VGPGPSVGIGRAPRSLGRLPTAAPGSRRHPTTNRFLRPRSRIESGGGARARGPTATRRSRRALRPVGVTGGDAPSPPPAPLRATTPHTPGEEDHWAFFLSVPSRSTPSTTTTRPPGHGRRTAHCPCPFVRWEAVLVDLDTSGRPARVRVVGEVCRSDGCSSSPRHGSLSQLSVFINQSERKLLGGGGGTGSQKRLLFSWGMLCSAREHRIKPRRELYMSVLTMFPQKEINPGYTTEFICLDFSTRHTFKTD
jgi:hypothetical protein